MVNVFVGKNKIYCSIFRHSCFVLFCFVLLSSRSGLTCANDLTCNCGRFNLMSKYIGIKYKYKV